MFLTFGAIAVSSYTVKEFKSNAFATVCYNYSVTGNTSLAPADPEFVTTAFNDDANWTSAGSIPPTTLQCPDGDDVCRICFDDNLAPVTFDELLQDLRSYIITNGEPADRSTINLLVTGAGGNKTVPVTIYKEQED